MDLYQQLENIHQQCRSRRFSDKETIDVMRLCIYAFLDKFPKTNERLPTKNHVLTSVGHDLKPSLSNRA